MQSGTVFILLLFVAVSKTAGQIETNITVSPATVPHGEVAVIYCGFNIPLESVGLISIELGPEAVLYEYQPDTGGVIGEGYEDKIISDAVDEGFVRLEMVVEMVVDTSTYYCLLIDENFDSYLSSDDLEVELPLLQVTTDPPFIRHGDRVTVRCEFIPLPIDIWDTITVELSNIQLLYVDNRYPSSGINTLREGATTGYYEMITASFTGSAVQGTFVANYPGQNGDSIECSLTDRLGNSRTTSVNFNIFTDHYVTITPNPAVVGQEVEFRCSFGYFASYLSSGVYWTKDDVQIIHVYNWGSSTSSLSVENILMSEEGDGIHRFTKIATVEDSGIYGCWADTNQGGEVSYKYVNFTVFEMDDMTTVDPTQDVGEDKSIILNVEKEARKIKSTNVRKEAELKIKKEK